MNIIILVRRGWVTNYHLITYLFSNISAKNYQNPLMCIEVIAWNVIVVFLRHSVCTCVLVVIVFFFIEGVCASV